MAKLLQAFNANNVDPSQGAPSLPVGRHPVIIVEDEIKATKANDGGFVEFTLQIIDGPMKGQTGALRLGLYNASEKAVAFAQSRMSAICHAIKVFNVEDMAVMHNKPFMVDVGLQKGEEAQQKGYTEVNKIYDINGNEPGKGGGQQQQSNNGGAGQFDQQQGQFQQKQEAQGPAGNMGGNGWGQQTQAQQQPQQQPQNGGNSGGGWGQQGGAGAQQQTQAQGGWGQQQPQQNGNGGGQQQQGGWQQNQGGGNAGPGWGQRN